VRVSCVCSIVVAVLLMLIRHETVAAAASLVSTGANKRKKSGLNRRWKTKELWWESSLFCFACLFFH